MGELFAFITDRSLLPQEKPGESPGRPSLGSGLTPTITEHTPAEAVPGMERLVPTLSSLQKHIHQHPGGPH